MKTKILFTLLFFACRIHYLYGQTNLQIAPETLATPEKNGIWLQPAQNTKAQPIWGFANGIRIGIAPLGGPRGLIRIYTPYLEHDEFVVTNFIAFEPIDKAKNNRGLSELEWSQLDNVRGKRFWSGNTPEAPSFPNQYYPAHGVIAKENGVETLTVYFFCETFDNGADIYVRTKFTEGKPYEFELTTYTTEESDELNRFILTATMGNKARLRTLHLADGKTKEAGQLWPSYKDSNFTEHNHTPVAEMIKDKNDIQIEDITIRSGLVPSVYGMGAKDAVFLLESAGLRVSISGAGKVKSQSIPAGNRVQKGKSILITLK